MIFQCMQGLSILKGEKVVSLLMCSILLITTIMFTPSMTLIWIKYLIEYQLLEQSDIAYHVWQSAKDKSESEESTFIRMDIVWALLSASTGYGCTLKFARLSKVARFVLVLPHSNAGEERVLVWCVLMEHLQVKPQS